MIQDLLFRSFIILYFFFEGLLLFLFSQVLTFKPQTPFLFRSRPRLPSLPSFFHFFWFSIRATPRRLFYSNDISLVLFFFSLATSPDKRVEFSIQAYILYCSPLLVRFVT